MAQKHPAKDAVSAAMSAIENALNLSGDARNLSGDARSSGGKPQVEPTMGKTIPGKTQEPGEAAPSRRLARQDDIDDLLVDDEPANDDRPAIGPIVQALQMRRASPAPVVAAAFGSLLWLAFCAIHASARFPWGSSGSTKLEYLVRPETVLQALAALGPMILFFGFAALARRLHELRLSARSITQVALRLAEPETVAGENVASLSQAIRREIATMGDGIERALARAAELETLVRSEVTTLERAYSDNERRIRSLIAEMADQREAILASGGRVRAVIDDAHRGIANDLETIAIRLSDRVSSVGGGVATSIGISAEEFTQAMDRAGASTVDRIGLHAAQLRDSLTSVAADVSARLAAASGHSAEEIIGRVADIDQRIRGAGEALAADFAGRNEDLVSRIEMSGTRAIESLRRHSEAIVVQLSDATDTAGRALDAHDGVVVARITESSSQAAEAIRLHGDAVATRLSVASESLAREFGQRIDDLVDRVESSARGVSDTVVAHGDSLASRLDLVADRLHESVVVRGQTLQDALSAANVNFESTLSGKTEDARALFESVGAAWSEHFDARHAQLRALIDDSAGGVAAQLEDSTRRATESIASESAATQDRLDTAARTALERWSDQAREIGEKFSSVASEAVATISVSGDSVQDALSSTIASLEDTLNARGGALVADLNSQTRRIDEQLGALNGLIGEGGESVVERLGGHTARFGETLTGHIDSLDQLLSARRGDLDQRLSEHHAHLNQRMEEHQTRFDESFTDHRGQLNQRMEENQARFDENFTDHRTQLNQRLDEQQARFDESFTDHRTHLNQRMEEHQTRFDESLTDHRARFEEASAARLGEFETTAAANQTMTELALSTHTRAIDDLLRDGVTNIETSLSERGRDIVARIEAESKLLTAQLESTLTTIEQTVIVRGGELDERLARRSVEAVSVFDSGIEAADSRATNKLEEVRSSLEGILERIDTALTARALAIKESLARSTLDAAKTLGEGGREVTQSIVAKSTELEEGLRARTEALTHALTELAGDINTKLADRLDDMSGALGTSVERFRNDVVNPLHTLSGQLQAGGVEIAEALTRHAATLSETVETHVQRIGIESNAQLVARIEELRGLVEGPATELVVRLGARGDEVTGQIASISQQAAQSFDQQIANLVALMTRRGDDLLAAIAASASGSVRELGALSGQIGVAVESSTAALRAAAEASSESVRAAAEVSSESVRAAAELSSESVRAAAEASSESVRAAVDSSSETLRAAVGSSSQSLRAAAEAAQSQSSETIGALVSSLTSEIDRCGEALRDAVESNAGASVQTLNATGERMRGELGQVLERLGQVGSVLDRMVGAAGEQLVAVEGGLAERITQMQEALEAMAGQVAALDRLSAETRNETGALVDRLSGHTSALAEVARDLAGNQQTIDLALQSRHDSLQSLFVEIGEKSQEFDAVARHFAASFEESFAKAQTRAQEISASLTVSSKNAAASVAGQFEAIRDNAGKERAKTAEALQAAYDQANTQLNEVMTKTADRFGQSVSEVRQMAAEVQRQLEETRVEMRRGVLELPEETAEAANAMRRVVSDQIKALKELTTLIAASGGDFDVADPTPVKPAPRPEAPRKAEPARASESERLDDGQTLVAALAEPARPAAAPAPRARAQQPAAAPAAGERSQSGWLSNLLAAASRDEAPQSGERVPAEGGEGISLDVAKYVDTEAAAEMWDRWRGGDASAVSRRLYTAAGQQTFDEIRRRYRNDPPFQAAVTRYTQEFERLLAKVGQNDRDGTQSRATLLSDAGKVYTMLAHASGRLG
jgi:hypothetical protein